MSSSRPVGRERVLKYLQSTRIKKESVHSRLSKKQGICGSYPDHGREDMLVLKIYDFHSRAILYIMKYCTNWQHITYQKDWKIDCLRKIGVGRVFINRNPVPFRVFNDPLSV